MMKRHHSPLLLTVLLPFAVQAASPVGYNTILIIVIIELIVAFSIGVVCILFSFNLLRALKDAAPETLSSGKLPPRRNDALTVLPPKHYYAGNVPSTNQFQYNPLIPQNMRTRESDDFSHYHDAVENPLPVVGDQLTTAPSAGIRRNSAGSEWDFETGDPDAERKNNSLFGNIRGALSTFTGYIKPW
jgi:hypothetical protein